MIRLVQQVLCECHCSARQGIPGWFAQLGLLRFAAEIEVRKESQVREVQAVGGSPHDASGYVTQQPISGHIIGQHDPEEEGHSPVQSWPTSKRMYFTDGENSLSTSATAALIWGFFWRDVGGYISFLG